MSKNSEQLLIQNFKRTGEIQHISDLYAPYMPLVYGVCLKYLDRDTAKDAVMDIFEKLLVELKKHDAPNDFKVWLYVVAKNFCLMKLRSEGSKNTLVDIHSENFMEKEISLHPVDIEEEKDLNPALQTCIEQLKEAQRLTIEMFYFKKYCYREIAEKLKSSEKKVKSDIQNGKRNLKICIEGQKSMSK